MIEFVLILTIRLQS